MKNRKIIFKTLLGLFLLAGIIFFIIDQRKEVMAAAELISAADHLWLAVGLAMSICYILVHGLVYQFSFQSLSCKLSMSVALKLFLKRNFVSVFLPAGGFTSIGLFRNETEKEGISQSSTDFASVIYSLVNLLSLLILSLFVLFFWGLQNVSEYFLLFLAGSLFLWVAIIWVMVSFYRQGVAYRIARKFLPSALSFHQELANRSLSLKPLVICVIWALVVEFIGILHLYVSMLALHLQPSLEACLIAYTVATLFYCFSPFMKGLGVVEVSMVVLLLSFGYTEQQAISVSLIYRLFEFWIPLLIGGVSFSLRKDNILMRILPAVFLFVSGILHIVSCAVPAHIPWRDDIFLVLGKMGVFNSAIAVVIPGVVSVLCSIFLIRGLRVAWYLALIICFSKITLSLMEGHFYGDGLIAFSVTLMLVYSCKHYFVPNGRELLAMKHTLMSRFLLGALLYGALGFYLMNRVHFSMDFSFWNVIKAVFQSFVLLNDNVGDPYTSLARAFLYSLNFLGALNISALFYLALEPVFKQDSGMDRNTELAQELLGRYGRSAVDYFKTYDDKSFFFNEDKSGFMAYKITMGFAVVLEGPVCENDRDVMINLIQSFERYCRSEGLKVTYYRVDQKNLELYQQLGKKHFLIGEEAVVNLTNFNLQGKKRKSLRNAINNLERHGYRSECYRAPLSEAIIKQLRLVSDNWLVDMKRTERVFSQGMFDETKIRDSDIITLENAEGKVLAFLNVIPSFAPREATYDLIRKLADAPGGNMDVLLLSFMDYCREEGYQLLNMGLAPLSGYEKKAGLLESLISFLYQKNKYFRSTRGLRAFKDKFEPDWAEKYLVYSDDIDLLAAPLVINKVMRMINSHSVNGTTDFDFQIESGKLSKWHF